MDRGSRLAPPLRTAPSESLVNKSASDISVSDTFSQTFHFESCLRFGCGTIRTPVVQIAPLGTSDAILGARRQAVVGAMGTLLVVERDVFPDAGLERVERTVIVAIEFFRLEVSEGRFDDGVVLRAATCRERLPYAVLDEQLMVCACRIVRPLVRMEDESGGRLSKNQGV